MRTPIVDFVRQYASSDALRLHMPGHKGQAFLGMERYDLTEIDGADVLYHADGIIEQSEENAASLFGTRRTVYSTEGSSLAIRAMLYLAKLYSAERGKPACILAARNAHKTFVTAAALLRIEVRWLFPKQQETLLSCTITPEELEQTLLQMQSLPTAFYLTSPDYLGNLADLEGLSRVCRKYGVLLLVDNAHGAYLRFLHRHPIELGADLCCDSAHKTLPVLTGGAYLHISQNAPELLAEQAAVAMSLFASTSPSYLILQSLDAANAYLAQDYRQCLSDLASAISELKQRLACAGWALVGEEAIKLTLAPKSYGYTGLALAQLLKAQNIVCEFADPDYLVMMLTPEIGEEGLVRLETALRSIEKRPAIETKAPTIGRMQQEMPMHEALFSVSRELAVEQCCGRVLAAPSITCPPAIPIVVCGERIDAAAVECMRYYGIDTCRVVEKK